MALYLDTSALVKLVVRERESGDLRDYVGDREVVSSLLARTELIRAIARSEPDAVDDAEDLLASMRLAALSEVVAQVAAWIRPWQLRSLDALHVASAQMLRGGLDALVTYDGRMAEAGRRAGLPVASPGGSPA